MIRTISSLFIAVVLLGACAESKDAVVEPVPDHQTTPSNECIFVQGRNMMLPNSTIPFIVKGVSLDGWLSADASVYGLSATASPWQMDLAFKQLFGPYATANFWNIVKNNYITEDDIKAIASMGFKTVRVPLDYRQFSDVDYMGEVKSSNKFNILDRLFGWCRDAGLYVILDMRGTPGGQTDDGRDNGFGYPWLLTDRTYQSEFIKIWTAIASQYRNEKQLLGYELIDAPLSDASDALANASSALEPLYIRTMKAMRSADANHIIIFDGANAGTDFSGFSHFDLEDNVVYACQTTNIADIEQQMQEFVTFRETKSGWPLLMTHATITDASQAAQLTSSSVKNNVGYIVGPYKGTGNNAIATIQVPNGWESVKTFVNADKSSYSLLYQARNASKVSGDVLENFAAATKLANCTKQNDLIQQLVK